MQFAVFRISPTDPDGVDDLNAFLRKQRVTHVERQFVADGEHSHWVVLITYRSGRRGDNDVPRDDTDYLKQLPEDLRDVYNRVRTARNDRAQQDGTAAYNICSNRQLFELVRNKVTTLKALEAVGGFGKARIQKYGQFLVDAVQRELDKTDEPSDKKQDGQEESG